jgi:predicted transcriptional regulator of viral defense system
VSLEPATKPDWDRLHAVAVSQEGYFTTAQAADAGYSSQLLSEQIPAGRIERCWRLGIYRFVDFPAGDHEDLIVEWLWSERAGVFSHQTALARYDLSDVLPARTYMTLPAEWRDRGLLVSGEIVVHYDDVPLDDRVWFGPVPITSPRRTLEDCARGHLSPDLLRQAARQALSRGLVVLEQLPEVEKALAPFGGIVG